MLPVVLMSVPELAAEVARRARSRRVQLGMTQEALAERAGMSLSSLRRFERTGNVAFTSLLRIAFALDAVTGFEGLFPEVPASLDEVLAQRPRQRGRRR